MARERKKKKHIYMHAGNIYFRWKIASLTLNFSLLKENNNGINNSDNNTTTKIHLHIYMLLYLHLKHMQLIK